MDKVFFGIVILMIGFVFGYFIAAANIKQPEPAIADAPITLDTLEKQCELTVWTRKGQATFVKIPADEIINQLKGADGVPNGVYASYYQVEGLTYNGNKVFAITGFMPEVKDEKVN